MPSDNPGQRSDRDYSPYVQERTGSLEEEGEIK